MTRNVNTRNETGEIITDITDIEIKILEYYKKIIIFHNMYIMQKISYSLYEMDILQGHKFSMVTQQ